MRKERFGGEPRNKSVYEKYEFTVEWRKMITKIMITIILVFELYDHFNLVQTLIGKLIGG